MPPKSAELNTLVRELLESGEVDLVIGYTSAPGSLYARPAFLRDPGNAKIMVFDRTCENNLAVYLREYAEERVAVVVKGCDERSVIGLIQEKQVDRDRLVLIGAPCPGVIDPGRVSRASGCAEAVLTDIGKDHVRVTCPEAKQLSLAFSEVIYTGCESCSVHNPRTADYMIAEPVPQDDVTGISPEMEEVAAMSREDRWGFFEREMAKCISCRACRDLCPACYCSECFVDSSQPRLSAKSADLSDVMFFHLTRLMHLAGRCTGCGACVRGCPVGVKLHLYNDLLRRESAEVFGFEAGMDPDAEPPLSTFRADDSDDFIM